MQQVWLFHIMDDDIYSMDSCSKIIVIMYLHACTQYSQYHFKN